MDHEDDFSPAFATTRFRPVRAFVAVSREALRLQSRAAEKARAYPPRPLRPAEVRVSFEGAASGVRFFLIATLGVFP